MSRHRDETSAVIVTNFTDKCPDFESKAPGLLPQIRLKKCCKVESEISDLVSTNSAGRCPDFE